jgi:hypothetical protein
MDMIDYGQSTHLRPIFMLSDEGGEYELAAAAAATAVS